MWFIISGVLLATTPCASIDHTSDLLAHDEKHHDDDRRGMDFARIAPPVLAELDEEIAEEIATNEDTALPSFGPASSLRPPDPPLNRPLPMQLIAMLAIFALVRRRS